MNIYTLIEVAEEWKVGKAEKLMRKWGQPFIHVYGMVGCGWTFAILGDKKEAEALATRLEPKVDCPVRVQGQATGNHPVCHGLETYDERWARESSHAV